MRRVLLLVALCVGPDAVRLAAQECVGGHALVLSGGGARGIAHVGVIRVLDSIGYRPDFVVGTSIGSIMGALVATGYDARQIDSIMRSLDVAHVLTAPRPFAPRAFDFIEPVIVYEAGRGLNIVSGATIDMHINSRLSQALLLGNLSAGGNFDSLAIPYAAVATDLSTRDPVILKKGDLAHAARASMSIPIVFYPQTIDGHVLVDGGIVDNLPITPGRMREPNLLVVDISSKSSDTLDISSVGAIARQIYELLLGETEQPLRPNDQFVRPAIDAIGLLDFAPQTMTLAESLGVRAMTDSLPSWKCRPAPRPHVQLPSGPFRLASFTIAAPRASERRFLEHELGLVIGDSLNLEQIRRAYRGMEASSEVREMWLNPSRTDSGLRLAVAMTPPPPRKAAVTLAVDYDNVGRLGLAYVDRTIFGGEWYGSIGTALGRYKQSLYGGLRPNPSSWNPIQPELRFELNHEYVRNFDSTGFELPSSDTRDGSAILGLEQANQYTVRRVGLIGGAWTDPSGTVTTGGVALQTRRGSEAHLPVLNLDAIWTGKWSLATAEAGAALRAGQWRFLGGLRAGTGNHLPTQLRIPLGGSNGFPGYAVYELRGDAELYASAGTEHPVLGPLRVRGEIAGGRSFHSLEDRVLGGGRLLGVVGTPIGELSAGYGWATTGRHGVFARLGVWF